MIRNHLTSLFLSFIDSSAVVDPVRDALTTKSDAWFRGVWISGIVVAVGCVLEAWEVSRALRNWKRARNGTELHPENPGSWMHLLAALGLFLVVGGIVSETVFEVLDANVESKYRSHEADRIKEADDKAAAATLQAGEASKSAKTAHDESSAAKKTASEASDLATGARQEADSFEEDIRKADIASEGANLKAAAAGDKAAHAEKDLANAYQAAANALTELNRFRTPRSLINIDKVVADLQPFAGNEYQLETASRPEQIELTKEIAAALDKAGWLRKQPQQVPLNSLFFALSPDKPAEGIPPCTRVGIGVMSHVQHPSDFVGKDSSSASPLSLRATVALQETLSRNISPFDAKNVPHDGNLSRDSGVKPTEICVGEKP